ncbi:MAG TPA: PAS domain-containing protein [Parafilimonas sp.]|nr:PAS domain-containing protein [Parafilimonas sp.]
MISEDANARFTPVTLNNAIMPSTPGVKYFPAYAKFLLKNKLKEFAEAFLELSGEMKLPLLKFFGKFPEEKLLSIGIKNTSELLSYCAANKGEEYINASIEKWLNNQSPLLSKNQVVAEDITLLSFMRRKLFRQFITAYTSDAALMLNILNEADLFITQMELNVFKVYIQTRQQMFMQAQSLAQVGNWEWDIKTKKLSWSDEVYSIYELNPQTLINSKMIRAYNHPDDTDMVDKHMQWSLDTLKPHDFFYRIILKDGRQKILHAKGEVKLDKKEVPVEMFGTLQDVTDQKEKEKRLEDSRKFAEKLTNVSPCIITVYKVKTGKYIFINKAVQTLLGYDPGDFFKKGRKLFYELVHPDDVSFIREKNAQMVAAANEQTGEITEEITEFNYRLKHKDGFYRWIQTFATVFNRNKDNKVEDILNVSVDITESHALTAELAVRNEEIQLKELQYQRMISEVEDYAILLMDKDGFIQNWNKGAEKIKGYTASEIIGKNFRLFYRKEDQERKLPETLINEATEKGRASHEGWRVRKDGTTFWGSIVITAVHDENNNVIGFTKVTRNLTERKLAEDTLREYTARIEKHNEELQRINKDLNSFTYMASHDLQEPLRKIKTFCNMILSRGGENLSGDIAVYFEKIMGSVTRMQTLIDSLLTYSRATTGEVVLVPTNINVIIEEVKKELSELIVEKNVTIKAGKLPVIKAQPSQFQQLFFNLIENAIKYSRTDAPPEIEISAEKFLKEDGDTKSAFYRITISDNGIGFEQEYADTIFKLFQRLHGRNEYSGTGIGLAICKKIMENHEGAITARSEPGKGSAFIIELPA